MKLVHWFLITLGALLVETLFQDPISSLLVRIFGGFGFVSSRGIRGVWSSSYLFPSVENAPRPKKHMVRIKQIGNYVVGRSLHGTSSHVFMLHGHLRQEIFFTGYWRSLHSGSIHQGVFQLVLNNKGNELKGLVLGTSTTKQTHYGVWELTKMEN
jgi:hypothetical protein